MGQRLRERREHAKLSLGQVAEYEKIGRQYLSKLELGTNEPPTWDLLTRLADRYKTSADYLLGITDDPTPATVRGLVGGSETLAELLAVAVGLSDGRRREVLALARTVAELQREEGTPLERAIERVKGGQNPPRVIGGEEGTL